MEEFVPKPFHVVETPQQMKAFTDPLRIRVLVILSEQAATNQQLADALHEPQAKVLYHIQFLLRAGLIQLVDTRISGGNVEKYYRAIARTFDLRVTPEIRPNVLSAEFAVISQDVAASALAYSDDPPRFVARGRRTSSAQAAEFFERLLNFVNEYWDNPHAENNEEIQSEETSDPLYYCAAVVFKSSRQGNGLTQPNSETGE